ncbi:hypothetical protein B9Z55_009098 [Caenorhabditis nigoni]|uniref:Uncharacterized protein n=1 Tax=Caenorhabditis nigoni TaxID=1611254 RepID=A0A2G5UQK9_9PELO|nr:hypothetical protein B9Z55_009098 [Caenorhabditis nigoni]
MPKKVFPQWGSNQQSHSQCVTLLPQHHTALFHSHVRVEKSRRNTLGKPESGGRHIYKISELRRAMKTVFTTLYC